MAHTGSGSIKPIIWLSTYPAPWRRSEGSTGALRAFVALSHPTQKQIILTIKSIMVSMGTDRGNLSANLPLVLQFKLIWLNWKSKVNLPGGPDAIGIVIISRIYRSPLVFCLCSYVSGRIYCVVAHICEVLYPGGEVRHKGLFLRLRTGIPLLLGA